MPQDRPFVIQKKYNDTTVTVDVMPKRDEALVLAIMYAEANHDRFFPADQRYLHIGAKMTKLGEHIGYQFQTSHGIMVSYEVEESPAIRRGCNG